MSDNLPPQQPGQPGPSGQWGAPPPQGPPPGWESGPGQPIPPQPAQGGGRKKGALLGGGLLLTGVLVAGGIVGWNLLSGDSELLEGDQPSQALPAGTLAYAAVDLDPSGKQKIEAIRTLKTFPAFNDEVRISEDDDVLGRIFELAQEEDDWCAELDYEKDVSSWLGDRFAIAAVADGKETPFPVGVVQVAGEDEARAGLEKIQACAEESGEDEEVGIAFVDDTWAVVAETQQQVDTVVAGVEDGTLRDDEDFQQWTEETGEAGIVHLYAAPALGPVMIEHFDELFGMGGEAFGSEGGPGGSSSSEVEIPETTRRQLENFSGAAGTIRFADGALEAEFVGSTEDAFTGLTPSSAGAEAVSSLPATTAAAFGLGLEEGWLDVLLDQMGPMFEEELGMSSDDALAELEKHTGLTKDDIEALGGESIAIAVDGDIDPDVFRSQPDPSEVPVGLKIKGDTDKIEAALDKLRESGGPEVARYLLSRSEGDYVAIAMNADYLDTLAGEGGLGDEDVFEDLAGADDPAMVFFVSFDANDNWLDTLVSDMGAPEEFRENLEPLSGVGMSAWVDGDVAHSLLKITTG